MRETIEKKPRFSKLDGFKVQFKPMPVCKSVLITNFAEKTTKDGIMLKLEHPSIGGEDSVENIDLQEDNKYAVVHLENPDGKGRFEYFSVFLEKAEIICV